ncbi:uncharacterized protein [Diabrotica undecimpunctata]|uniref:uncharacterized protein n=1 Tax=Diabrotica undecimpunctata TaxID=50387 RepID=UPI003B63CBD1
MIGDDLALVAKATKKTDMANAANTALCHIRRWIRDNDLQLAPQKTEVLVLNGSREKSTLRFIVEGVKVALVKSINYLVSGEVWLSEELRFGVHIQKTIVTRDLKGFSQPTVSRCIFKISRLLAYMPTYIKFSKGLENQKKNQRLFNDIANFPKVTGCIDCTHIPIKSPGGNIAEYIETGKDVFQ